MADARQIKVTFLGTGTSQGVPVIACSCAVCKSKDPRDNRLRSSVMITVKGVNYVIDTGPDFRQQMLANNVQSLRAIIYTHEHKDHIAGMDDIRAFNFKEQRDMDIFCSERVEEALVREFHYVFEKIKYPGTPSVRINRIQNKPFYIPGGIKVTPIETLHYRLPVFGFRIGDFTYITDAKTVSTEERAKIRGTKVLVINVLRILEHVSHFNLEEALAFIKDINPEKTYITHISHLFAKHVDIEKMLPPNVFAAYDGLVIEV